MNIEELKKTIRRKGLENLAYNLGDKPMRELEIGIMEKDGKYQLYSSYERGGYHVIEEYENVSDAYKELLYYLEMEKKRNEYFDRLESDGDIT